MSSRRLRIAACVPFPSAPHRPTAQPKINPYRDPFLSSDSAVAGVPAVSGEDHGEEVARMARRGASAAAPGAVLARADRKGEDREMGVAETDWEELQRRRRQIGTRSRAWASSPSTTTGSTKVIPVLTLDCSLLNELNQLNLTVYHVQDNEGQADSTVMLFARQASCRSSDEG